MAADVAGSLETFIAKRFSLDASEPGYNRDAHLWHLGFLDSIALAEILTFVQKQFGVSIPPEMLEDPALGSVNGMSRAIEKLGAK